MDIVWFESRPGSRRSSRSRRALAVSPLVVALWLVSAPFASAQPGGAYDLAWSSVDHGGGLSLGGSYRLTGVAGQFDAGELAGGDYRLAAGLITSVPPGSIGVFSSRSVPPRLLLLPPVPHPIRTAGRISFELPAAGRTRLRLFDVRGSLVAVLLDRPLGAGRHLVDLDRRAAGGHHVASGVYFLRLDQGATTLTHKLVIAR